VIGAERLAALQDAVADGDAHTVRVCFPDHYGVLRGRRIAADVFVADPDARQGFCDGALVWDIRCDIFEGTDFTNYRTGYPDLYVRPEHETLGPCAWVEGEWSVLGDCRDHRGDRIDVDPRGILRGVAARAGTPRVATALQLHLAAADAGAEERFLAPLHGAAKGLEVGAVAIESDRRRGIVSVDLPALDPLAAADALVTLRTAARETARAAGVDMTAMAQTEPGGPATRLIAAVLAEDGSPRTLLGVEDLALLLRPLPAGAIGIEPAGREIAQGASDANPYLVVAAATAAAGQAAGSEADPPSKVDPYRSSIERLGSCEWAREWFPELFLHDAIALAEREAEICADRDGPWSLDRYRECG